MRQAVQDAMKSGEFQRAVAEGMERMERENQVLEEAPWIGKTGFGEELERELPRYLRREFGESLFDEGSLKASDLQYLGAADDEGITVHYWLMNSSNSEADGPTFAYIEVTSDGGTCTGWGDRNAPKHLLPR
jgi:hypothetical protein